jgi:hypothetical protein
MHVASSSRVSAEPRPASPPPAPPQFLFPITEADAAPQHKKRKKINSTKTAMPERQELEPSRTLSQILLVKNQHQEAPQKLISLHKQ